MSDYSKSRVVRRIKRMGAKEFMNKQNFVHTGKELLWDVGAGLIGAQIGKAIGGGTSLITGLLLMTAGEWQNTVDQADKDYNGDSVMKTLGMGILAGGSLDVISIHARQAETKLLDKLKAIPQAVADDVKGRIAMLRKQPQPAAATVPEEAVMADPAVSGLGTVDYYNAGARSGLLPGFPETSLDEMLQRMNAAGAVPMSAYAAASQAANSLDSGDVMPELI